MFSVPPPPPASTDRQSPFQTLLGYQIVRDDAGLVLKLPIRDELLNLQGVIHGGVALTLLDAVGGRALMGRTIASTGQTIRSSVTATLTTDFIGAVSSGVLYARASPDHIGKTLAYVSLRLTHGAVDGPVIARGLATYRIYTQLLNPPR